jgi:hypothetical protein
MRSCDGLVGLSEPEVVQRLGTPSARREVGPDTWLVFGSDGIGLRIRLAGSAPPRVASWTASFDSGFRLLSEATRSVGLWPAAAPDEDASTVSAPLVRRPLPCRESSRVHSLTASVRGGFFTGLSVFDESPDWL